MKKNDITLIAIIIVIVMIFFVFYAFQKETGSTLVVTVDGEFYQEYSLHENQIITIEDEDGHKNVFEIKDGVATMIEASCPDKLCISQHPISFNHETIVCLPNKVVLTVENAETSEVDMISQ